MTIRVNWNQGKVASDGLIRAHIVKSQQPNGCQFGDLKTDYTDYPDVLTAEAAMKQNGYSNYKHCKHCWDDRVIDPIP